MQFDSDTFVIACFLMTLFLGLMISGGTLAYIVS